MKSLKLILNEIKSFSDPDKGMAFSQTYADAEMSMNQKIKQGVENINKGITGLKKLKIKDKVDLLSFEGEISFKTKSGEKVKLIPFGYKGMQLGKNSQDLTLSGTIKNSSSKWDDNDFNDAFRNHMINSGFKKYEAGYSGVKNDYVTITTEKNIIDFQNSSLKETTKYMKELINFLKNNL